MKEEPTDKIPAPGTDNPETDLQEVCAEDGMETEELAGAPGTDATEGEEEEPSRSLSTVGEFTRSEEAEQRSNLSLRQILGGDILTGEWLRRQMGLIVLCCLFVIVYITNRYSAEQEIIEIDRLKVELQEIKYRALTRSSELTVKSRQSQIEEYLKRTNDSTLTVPKAPPFRIKMKTE